MRLEVLELVGVSVDVVVARRGRILKECSLIGGDLLSKNSTVVYPPASGFLLSV